MDLTGFVNPLAVWGDVLTTTLTDIGKLGQEYAADPFPIVRQLIANQMSYVGETVSIVQGMANGFRYWASTVPGQLQTISQQLATGHISDAVMTGNSLFVNAVAATFFPLLGFDIPQKMAQNVANVVAAITPVATGVGFALLSTVYEGNKALADTAQKFYDAVKSGDLVTSLSELINAPANVIGGVLNGYGTDKGTYGIFGSYEVVHAVLNGLKTIANAIKPPAPEAPVAATVDGPAAVPASATKALAPETTAAVDTGATVKEAPEKFKAPVAKADPKPATPVATEAETPKTEPVKVAEPVKTEVSTPAADPVSAEPVKVETTKPVHNDTTTSETGTKAAGATSSDADSAGKSDKPDKPAGKGQKAEKAPKAQKAPKAPNVAKQPKKASSTQQSANAG
ncbi:hypothetical protein [Mycolicibacterium mucogenicum]|uniref:PE-PGRS family protein n=1 Tax=Mycolicibacterium mucogenicum DSM 44124 TaxID=1226753 RepID=A0A8E4R732_MYCMU|nr:hypothetical protein [Mycolicibacterium mucogenicum]QPG68775.1 hypothetical protein C1S78_025695 [Mycolicibacterium mucogenicum DSM 44124]